MKNLNDQLQSQLETLRDEYLDANFETRKLLEPAYNKLERKVLALNHQEMLDHIHRNTSNTIESTDISGLTSAYCIYTALPVGVAPSIFTNQNPVNFQYLPIFNLHYLQQTKYINKSKSPVSKAVLIQAMLLSSLPNNIKQTFPARFTNKEATLHFTRAMQLFASVHTAKVKFPVTNDIDPSLGSTLEYRTSNYTGDEPPQFRGLVELSIPQVTINIAKTGNMIPLKSLLDDIESAVVSTVGINAAYWLGEESNFGKEEKIKRAETRLASELETLETNRNQQTNVKSVLLPVVLDELEDYGFIDSAEQIVELMKSKATINNNPRILQLANSGLQNMIEVAKKNYATNASVREYKLCWSLINNRLNEILLILTTPIVNNPAPSQLAKDSHKILNTNTIELAKEFISSFVELSPLEFDSLSKLEKIRYRMALGKLLEARTNVANDLEDQARMVKAKRRIQIKFDT